MSLSRDAVPVDRVPRWSHPLWVSEVELVMNPSPYRTPVPPRDEPAPDADVSPAIVVLVLVAAAAIIMLSHPKPAPPPAFGGAVGSPAYFGAPHGHGHGHGPSCR
jgi:hypothetical protein